MEPQVDLRFPVDNMPAGHNQPRGDSNPRAPELSTVHKAHGGVFDGFCLVGCGRHVEACLFWMEPNISEWILTAHAADDAPEDGVDGADESEAYPLVGLPSKGWHDQSNETHAVRAFHRKQPPALGAWQAPGICEDDSVVLSCKVTDDTPAEGADEEI